MKTEHMNSYVLVIPTVSGEFSRSELLMLGSRC